MGDDRATSDRGEPDRKAAERKRLAEALRANLKRRKAAASRNGAEGAEGETPDTADRAGQD